LPKDFCRVKILLRKTIINFVMGGEKNRWRVTITLEETDQDGKILDADELVQTVEVLAKDEEEAVELANKMSFGRKVISYIDAPEIVE